jgi:hypothetical protein
VSTQSTGPVAADRSASDAAALLPTATTTTAGPTDHVTAAEIAEFLRHLARFRSPAAGADPAEHAALLARKAELFARIADQHARAATGPPSAAAPTTPTAPEGRTP